jgi:hypothetical protein
MPAQLRNKSACDKEDDLRIVCCGKRDEQQLDDYNLVMFDAQIKTSS